MQDSQRTDKDVKIVLGAGPAKSRFMLIGEAPGRVESERGMPFVGPSGKLLDSYLEHSSLPPLRSVYRTNVCKEYRDSNPKPTPDQIRFWTPDLLSEIADVQPEIIIAIGSYAAEWCLGQSIPDLETIHGMPHYPTRHDFPPCVKTIFPVFHPAGALWNYERRSIIRYGYELIGAAVKRLDRGLPIHYRHDPFSGTEDYRDVTGGELAAELDSYDWVLADVIGLDTEGTPSNPWSIQISHEPGSGLILRCSQSDFSTGVKALSDFLRGSRSRPVIAMHQASTPTCSCYDVVMCRAMGLELQGLEWFDTMYWAYTRRLEPQGNKPLCERWQGMEMEDYHSLIGDIGRNKQIKWLETARSMSADMSKPSKRSEKLNTGQTKVSQPKHIHASIDGILRDIRDGKETKDGPTDPLERWKGLAKSNPQQVRQVEGVTGRMPVGTLDDVSLEKAVFYGCRDSDGSLRNALTFMELDL